MTLRIWLIAVPMTLALAACGGAPTPEPQATEAPTISFDDAAQIVLDEVVQQEQSDEPVIVFGWPELLQTGDVVHPYEKTGYEPFSPHVTIEERTWFFWIDDAPGAAFVHDNRFVFVDGPSGEVTVREEMWWPVLNGQGMWVTDEAYWNESAWVFSNVDYRPQQGPPPSSGIRPPGEAALAAHAPPSLQDDRPGAAIVINGWEEGERLQDDLAISSDQMHDILTAAKFDTVYYGPEQDENPDRDGVPSREDDSPADRPWRTWLREQQGNLEPGDTLFIYLTGHGGVTDSGVTGAGGVFEDALHTELSGFDAQINIIVFVDGCHSGGFLDSLRDVADLTITSTNETGAAYGDIDPPFLDASTSDTGNEFTSGFVEDWNEVVQDQGNLQDVQERGSRAGANFWRLLSAESYVSARDKDAAYAFGWTDPHLQFGSHATKGAGGFAAEYDARLVTTEGQGECGYPTGYQTTLDVQIADGQMSTYQADADDLNEGQLAQDLLFTIEREDGAESYEGTLDPETLEGTGTLSYTDTGGCQSTWSFTFTPTEVDLQTGPNTALVDGISVPWDPGLLHVETAPGGGQFMIELVPGGPDGMGFNLFEIPFPLDHPRDIDGAFDPVTPRLHLWDQGELKPLTPEQAGALYYPTTLPPGLLSGRVGEDADLLAADHEGRLLYGDENGLPRINPITGEVIQFDFSTFEDLPNAPANPSQGLDLPSPIILIEDGALIFSHPAGAFHIPAFEDPGTVEFIPWPQMGEIYDISPMVGETDLLSISTADGIFGVPPDDLLLGGSSDGPLSQADQLRPPIGPGPHIWAHSPDGEPILIHATGSQLFADLPSGEILIADLGFDIDDLESFLGSDQNQQSDTRREDTGKPPGVETPDIRQQSLSDESGDEVVCDSGDPIEDPAVDIQDFRFEIPVDEAPRVEVFTVHSPLQLFGHFSYSLQVRVGHSGDYRVGVYENHDGDTRIGELETVEEVAPGTQGQILPGENSVLFAFPNYEPVPGDTVTVQAFHMETSDSPRTCDASRAFELEVFPVPIP